jgi:NTP pyrophosphatase (non-canonical NTP hydrolase)
MARFGMHQQMLKLIEELGELTRASSRWLNESVDEYDVDIEENLCEEIADVEILLDQVKSQLDHDVLSYQKQRKLMRLNEMLEKKDDESGFVANPDPDSL